ncbi:CopG family transcriptional regulator [Desulfobacterales bacterium HSG2]|nr:CopG family transcriptional regulator [Desulfobacterales bacterium HSG2]
MTTISTELDEDIIKAVDAMVRTVRTLDTTRSAFMQHTLRTVIQQYNPEELEERHRKGYMKKPVEPGEFSDWEDEQMWINE